MPTTRNVAWDGRLQSFKGRDTANYVTTAADLAKTCASCQGLLEPDEPASLLVDITQSTAPDGTEYLTFTDALCHRRCSGPGLAVRQTPWQPDTLSPVAARVVLTQKSRGGRTRVVPVLVFTFVPVLSFREDGGELTSALVSLLLGRGFQLAMSPDYAAILEQATEAAANCRISVTPAGLLRLRIDGEVLYREQLNTGNADDAEWLQAAAQGGHILVISGDNLGITETGLDINPAARHGTLVIGTVPVSGGDVFVSATRLHDTGRDAGSSRPKGEDDRFGR
ncbi:hypothetical protein ACFVTE_09850 [Arthrobacter sp. NPDC058097]|uniref:hypothetical protein n=1 Tax=Arthrobacter sp. NPDC058097 TaxID=3346340 RepID=UPI0036D9BA4A